MQNTNAQAIAAELGIRFDGILEWGGRVLFNFTALSGPAAHASFCIKNACTLDAVRAKLQSKQQEFAQG